MTSSSPTLAPNFLWLQARGLRERAPQSRLPLHHHKQKLSLGPVFRVNVGVHTELHVLILIWIRNIFPWAMLS